LGFWFDDILFLFLLGISDPLMEPYPHQFATALFSFLYHLASYDAGGEALVSCGMMEALLKVGALQLPLQLPQFCSI